MPRARGGTTPLGNVKHDPNKNRNFQDPGKDENTEISETGSGETGPQGPPGPPGETGPQGPQRRSRP